MRVILASASPRRRELLARMSDPFEVWPALIDEVRRPGEPPEVYARRLAREKALRLSGEQRDAWVLGADTIVCVDGDVLGKPRDARDAAAMLAKLSGRAHRVLTAFVWARAGEVAAEDLVATEVAFRELSDGEIATYVRSGEPADKAGAYAIQGDGARFVRSVRGSITNVIGLPLDEVAERARALGVPGASQPLSAEAIALRQRSLRGEIAALAVASGRSPEAVRMISVSKGHPVESICAAIAGGATDLGENYVQEGVAKRRAVEAVCAATRSLCWHLIGPLQRNKARQAVAGFELVHTLDRVETAQALVRVAARPVAALIQVNVDRDPAKSGVAPERLDTLLEDLQSLGGLRIEGLMTIGSAAADPGAKRESFRELRERLARGRELGLVQGEQLSMGMSGDYDVAIAEGATLVRLGTVLFGPRSNTGEAGRQRG